MIKVVCVDRHHNTAKGAEILYIESEHDVAMRVQNINPYIYKAAIVIRERSIQIWELGGEFPEQISAVTLSASGENVRT